jgi:hypothetical protein
MVTSSTARTTGNEFRKVLFMVLRLLIPSRKGLRSISFCLAEFRL